MKRALLILTAIASLTIASISHAGTAKTHGIVNFQSVRKPQTGDNVAIGSATYNSETQGFDRPWPFGPEANPQ
jgi:hypothetical protein